MTRSRVAWSLAAVDMLAFIVVVLVDPAPDYGAFRHLAERHGARAMIRSLAAWVIAIANEVEIATVTADLDATVRATVRPVTTQLWVRGSGRPGP